MIAIRAKPAPFETALVEPLGRARTRTDAHGCDGSGPMGRRLRIRGRLTMTTAASTDFGLDPQTRSFYQLTIAALQKADAPFLVGGAYAMAHYTGITRHTRDLDVFVRPQDARQVLQTLERAVGCTSKLTFPWWLGKAVCGDYFVDVIFSSGNGITRVDDIWFW